MGTQSWTMDAGLHGALAPLLGLGWPLLAAAAAAVFALVLPLLIRASRKVLLPAVPSTMTAAPAHWLLGSARMMVDTMHDGTAALVWPRLLHEHGGGRALAFRLPGQLFILLNDAEALRTMGVKRSIFIAHELNRDAFGAFARGVIALEGPEWLRHRRAMNRAFLPDNLRIVAAAADDVARAWLGGLLAASGGAATGFNSNVFMSLYLEVMGRAMLGADVGGVAAALGKGEPKATAGVGGPTAHAEAAGSSTRRRLTRVSVPHSDMLAAVETVMHAVGTLSLTPRALWRTAMSHKELAAFETASQLIRGTARQLTDARVAAMAASPGGGGAGSGGSEDAQHDFLDVMIAETRPAASMAADGGDGASATCEAPLTLEEVVDETMIMVLGATETSAHTTSWLLYALARDAGGAAAPEGFPQLFELPAGVLKSDGEAATAHDNSAVAWRQPLPAVAARMRERAAAGEPTVWQRIFEEVSAVVGPSVDSPLEWAHIDRLTYTEGAVREALRLYNVAPGTARRVVSDTVLAGHAIPAQSIVMVANSVMHTDARYWPRPFEFLPQRWAEDAPADIAPTTRPPAFNAFGSGPKSCVGQRFGLVQVKIFVARMAQALGALAMADGAPAVYPCSALTTRPPHGVVLAVAPRAGAARVQ
jgi:cytochrome P450